MQSERPKSESTVGCAIEEKELRFAKVSEKRGKLVIEDTLVVEVFSDGEVGDVKPLYNGDKEERLQQLIKGELVISALASQKTLVRPLFVKLKKKSDIDAVIDFQAEPLFPFEPGEALVDWMELRKEEEGSELTVFGVKKEDVASHLESCSRYRVDPECVSTPAAALLSFAAAFSEESAPFIVAHIGMESSTCLLVEGGKLLSAKELPTGIGKIVELVGGDFSAIEFSSTSLGEELSRALSLLRLELLKNFYALAKPLKGEQVVKLAITGEAALSKGLTSWLLESLSMEEVVCSLPADCKLPREKFLQMAIAIGLAVSGLPGREGPINLRRGDLAHSNPLKRLTRPLLLYFTASLFVAFGIFLYAKASMGLQEDHLKGRFGDLLSYMNRSYDEFEGEYQKKLGRTEGGVYPLQKLSAQELYNRIDYLESEIDSAPQPIALMPNTPRVSDLLAWLSTHPNVVLAGEEGKEKRALIEIDSLNYVMVKRPEEKKRTNRYQVKVELEFTSATPKLAREFHDALIEEKKIVDGNGEVKWSSSRGKYRTSFFLKDRTRYP